MGDFLPKFDHCHRNPSLCESVVC